MKGEPLSLFDGVLTSIKDTTTVEGWPTRLRFPRDGRSTGLRGRTGRRPPARRGPADPGQKHHARIRLEGAAGHHPQPLEPRPFTGRLIGRCLVDDREPAWRPFNHGNDGGGSIRIPAAHTGLVGLKPALSGKSPQYPANSPFADVVSQGVLARSAARHGAGLNAMAGPDPRDWRWLPAEGATTNRSRRGRARLAGSG